jgi:hypothetical protein
MFWFLFDIAKKNCYNLIVPLATGKCSGYMEVSHLFGELF